MIDNSSTANWQNRWNNLSGRDRTALLILCSFLGLLLLVYGAMIPAHKYADRAADYYKKQSALQSWVEANADKVKSLPSVNTERDTEVNSQSLLSIASNSAKEHGISFKRFEPDGERELRIWLEKASFNQVIIWLQKLEASYGVEVLQANLDRRDLAGTVNGRVLLSL